MKKSLIALLLVAVFVFMTFGAVACDNSREKEATVKAISLVTSSLETEYTVGDTVDLSDAKIKVTMSDNTSKEVALTQSMLNAEIDTSKAGSTTYTITYEGKNVQFTVTVKNPSGVIEQVETYSMPQFVLDYEEKSKESDEDSDSSFKLVGDNKAVYEVGNANKFILNPVVTGFDSTDTRVTQSENVKTVFTLSVSGTADGTFTEVADSDLSTYVSAENNMYQFTKAAADKYFKLNVSLDTSAYIVGDEVTTSHELLFIVVENGYNVYDQDGLAVMTDSIQPEFWADILGCTVDANGAYVAGDSPLTLAADDKPLYQYIGAVDWIILHGSITIDPDKLPENYFWNDNYSWCKENRTTAEANLLKFEEALKNADSTLNGTLIDGNGSGGKFFINKYSSDGTKTYDNNNKAFYCTYRANVSGNYNSITVSSERSEGGRILKVLVGKQIDNKTDYFQTTQWHLFRMFQEKTQYRYSEAPTKEFTLKNIALKGNGGRNENVGPQGVSMVNVFAKISTVDNVVANGFYINFSIDNFYSVDSAVVQMDVNIQNSKIYDTYNAMAFTWRGKVNVKNSVLKDAGGPLFIISDGDGRVVKTEGENYNVPTVTVDEASVLESFSMGNESWYTQLGDAVPAMFAQLGVLDSGLQQISRKSFFVEKTVGTSTNSYASILAIMIPEADSALGNKDFNNYKITGEFNASADSFSMLDEKFRVITDALAGIGMGTVVLKSGNCYAFVWQDTAGNQVLVSYDMLSTLLYQYSQGLISNPVFDTSSEDYQLGLYNMAQDWQTNSTDMVTVWLQAQTGVSTSPYIGIVIGGYHAVEA